MADISRLSRLLNGVQRQVDLSTNTLVVDRVKFGGGAGTDLSQAILNRLISLQNGSDVDATYHTHDGRYFTESELSSTTNGSSGASLIGVDQTPAFNNFSGATVQAALESIDSALDATADEKVKISANDTTAGYLNGKLVAGTGISLTENNDGSNETLTVASTITQYTDEMAQDAVGGALTDSSTIDFTYNDGANTITASVIQSGIDHGSISGLGDDDHTQYILVDGTRAFTGAQSMGGNKLTNVTDPTAAQDAATKNYVDTQDALKVSKSGDTMSGNLNMGGNKIVSLGAPTVGTDATNKNYVDAAIAGLYWKNAARVATTANITLVPAPASIDGITLVSGDRVLVKNQTTASANGIYSFDGTDLVRASDADTASELNAAAIFVREGTANADTAWVQTADSITLETTSLVFTQFAGNGTIQAGTGLAYSGNTLNVNLGAGIQQLPSDEVGIDLYSTSGMMLTEDGSTSSTGTAAQLSLKLDGSTLSKSVDGVKVADAGITGTQLAASVAGNGLTGGAGSALAVGAGDGITVAADSVAVDASAIAGSGLENDGSNNLRIAASAAGGGLTGGAGSALAVGAGDGITVNADDVAVNTSAIAGSGLEDDGSNNLRIAASAAGAGLTGGAGSALAVGAGDGITVNADDIAVNTTAIAGSGLENDGSNNLRIATSAAGAGLTGGGGSALAVSYAPMLRKNSVIVGESFAANTTYAVRWAMDGETAGRVYKADKDTSSADKFHVIGVLSVGGSALSAGNTADLYMLGAEVAKATNDPSLAGTDVGKPVFLTAGGALTMTAPSAAGDASVIVGIVKDTSTFWIQPQIMGIN